MKLYEKMKIDLKDKYLISLVGGGGKTTTMLRLAKEFKEADKRVLVTTSTAICNIEESFDYYFLEKIREDFRPDKASLTIFGEYVENNKIFGKKDNIDEIWERDIFDIILVEADGANKKPIKAPRDYEPQIPNHTNLTIGLIGMDALGKNIGDIAHRPQIFMEILNIKEDRPITYKDMENLALHKEGLFKDSLGRKIVILNKADRQELIDYGRLIKDKLKTKDIDVLVGQVKKQIFY